MERRKLSARKIHKGKAAGAGPKGSLNKNLTRIIGLVSVAIFFAFLIYFAKYFTVFLESMR